MDSLALSPQVPQPKATGDAYLRLQLDDETPALFPMQYAQEVLIVPGQRLTAMPGMPVGVLGLMNRRSRVFWLVDLAQILGLPPLAPNLQQYNVALMRVGQAAMGLAVQEVKGVARFPRELIQSLQGPTPSSLAMYLQGMILQPTEVLLVLEAEAIARSPLLHSNATLDG